MKRRIAAFLLIGKLLFGSLLLPLGDFSALNELPRMYRAYEKVVSPDEKGILDFIGDYLLDGKNLLGHNKEDLPSKHGGIQFQHSGIFAMLFHPIFQFSSVPNSGTVTSIVILHLNEKLSEYSSSLFRPPLA